MKVFAFIVCFLLFAFSLWLFALAFHVPGFEAIIFFSGILLTSVSFAIPFNLMRSGS